ncbi:MAG: ATPase [Flavobacteriales bacterium]|nr:ATPase [Flavobacteriales bacterium]|tara:strand:+ start:22874 stop:24130 length:1257 start_codon:yes stop_codon:yes gene_type:complete
MVLEIRLSNFFSFDEEVVLDMRAANFKSEKARKLAHNLIQGKGGNVLKSAAIYGANASGKSNLIKTIRFCHAMVYDSHKHNENTNYNFQPFKLSNLINKPSEYFIRFITEGVEYEYSFSLTQDRIITEKLYYYPKGRIAKVFERDERKGKSKKEKYSFAPGVIKRPLDVAENTSDKTLYISRASQMDREIPKIIFNYFSKRFILRYFHFAGSHLDQLVKLRKPQLLKALQLADSDIIDFKHRVVQQKGKRIRANFDTEEATFEEDVAENIEIKTFHKYKPNVSFDLFREESEGTQKLFFMMLLILDIIQNNKVLLVDEIEDSLHPKIVEYIIDLFHHSKGAQLIFTTHNTNLLNMDRFRKDQIWFVNKKRNGGSELYSLQDYGDFRDTMDLEKAYLQGRFDSVPIVDDSTERIKSLIG